MLPLKMAASITGHQLFKHDYKEQHVHWSNVDVIVNLGRTVLCRICSAQAPSKQLQHSAFHLLNNTSVNYHRCHSLPCESLLSILLACCDQERPRVHKPPWHHHHFPAPSPHSLQSCDEEEQARPHALCQQEEWHSQLQLCSDP